MLLQLGQIVEGVSLVQFAGVDQDHEQVSHAGAVLGLVEVGVLAMQDRLLEGAFGHIIVEWCSRFSQEQSQRLPVLEHVGDRLAQTAVGFDVVLLDLFGQPAFELGHLRAAFGLMELQPLFRRHSLMVGLGIILVDILEDLQDIKALFGEVRRHIDKMPPSMGQAVGHDGLESITHLDGPIKLRCTLPQ